MSEEWEAILSARRVVLSRAREGLVHADPGISCLFCDLLDVDPCDGPEVERLLAQRAAMPPLLPPERSTVGAPTSEEVLGGLEELRGDLVAGGAEGDSRLDRAITFLGKGAPRGTVDTWLYTAFLPGSGSDRRVVEVAVSFITKDFGGRGRATFRASYYDNEWRTEDGVAVKDRFAPGGFRVYAWRAIAPPPPMDGGR